MRTVLCKTLDCDTYLTVPNEDRTSLIILQIGLLAQLLE
jgi:hypothetical protein